jgi:hypothetical protein
MKAQAFTLNAQTLLASIITPVAVRQALNLSKIYNLVSSEINVRALWDTGSTNTSISKGLARHLGLKSIDICNVNGVDGIHPSMVYQIDILLPSDVAIGDVRVAEFQDNGAFEILVGMDIINLGDFAISNKDGKSIVSFRIPPSDTVIDFVEEIKEKMENDQNKQTP